MSMMRGEAAERPSFVMTAKDENENVPCCASPDLVIEGWSRVLRSGITASRAVRVQLRVRP